jgi:hypothetical protein
MNLNTSTNFDVNNAWQGAPKVKQRTAILGIAICLLAGCAVWRTPATLPTAHELPNGPLLIHSDFELPDRDQLLSDLEEQRGRMQDVLRFSLSEENVHVYLFEDTRKYKAYMTRHFPGTPSRRAFFVESPTHLSVYAQWGDRVQEDLRHEVVHGYLHAVLRDIPLWLDEGIAEYFEVPGKANGVNRPHLELLQRELKAGRWQPDLSRLAEFRSTDEMTQLDYAESWAWVHFLLNSEPRRRILLQDHLRAKRNEGSNASIWLVLRKAEVRPTAALLVHLQQLSESKRR